MKILERIKNNPLASLIIFILLLWSTYPLALKFVLQKNDWNSLGTFGDTYGALNTLFSGLAFAVLILSLFLQRIELEAQRKELEAQRQEIKESNTIAEAQRKITEQQAQLIQQQILDSKKQAFFELFFKYIDEKNRKIELLKAPHMSGMSVMKRFCSQFNDSFTRYNFENIEDIDCNTLDSLFIQALDTSHAMTYNQLNLSQYAEFINFILDFIESNKHLGIKENAVLTLLSFLDISEVKAIFYLSYENKELKKNIEDFSLMRKISNIEENNETILRLINKICSDKATNQS
ncbi:hypothetical protein [Acinetobacter soli]|uniref:hypothetical protein n=1 Tax=Acinetobacter soli TaxID=487316 RepID=UPI001250323F|nr:hypothetical protein [Acinetobacter soli]